MQKQPRITQGVTTDQRLLIDIRNAIEDLTKAMKIAPQDRIRLAREVREVRDLAEANAAKLEQILAPEEGA